ncbi:MAG: CsgG/HfaB family protein [Burkholderiales bacterium]|nr:CsgG/HfaB family protein [Burkholderiales bacterium]
MNSPFNKTLSFLAAFASLLIVTGCSSMDMGSQSAKTAATGSAGGSEAQGANAALERCDQALGTMTLVEDVNAPWYRTLNEHKLGSTAPVLKLLAQQSNCFVVVERGRAMDNMMQERALAQSGELRQSSNFGKGQMVSADYSLSPSITFSNNNAGGIGAGIAGLIGGGSGRALAGVAGSVNFKEASTLLTLIDNRSGVQLAAAEGSAKNTDFGAMGAVFGGRAGGSLGGYTNTAEGKVIAAALTDAFNNIVRAVRNYKMQTVEGGLGTGRGGLQVQQEAPAPAPTKKAPAPASAPAKKAPAKK